MKLRWLCVDQLGRLGLLDHNGSLAIDDTFSCRNFSRFILSLFGRVDAALAIVYMAV